MSALFSKARKAGINSTPLDSVVASLRDTLRAAGGASFSNQGAFKASMALESANVSDAGELSNSIDQLTRTLDGIALEHYAAPMVAGDKAPSKSLLSTAQRQAGVVAGVLAGDIPAFLRAPAHQTAVAMENQTIIGAVGGDFMDRQRVALEAYDEKETKNNVVYSVAYNMQAARQDEFAEAFFPTVVVTPDQNGFSVAIRLIQVYNEVRRQVTGVADSFKKRNIIQAVIDPSVLRNDQLKIVPVCRSESLDKFVDATLLPAKDVSLEGEVIHTSALAVGKKLSLLGISQTAALLETGLQDSTDSIDTAVTLEAIYVKIPGATSADDRVLKFTVLRHPTAVFTYAQQGNYRQLNLNFTSTSLKVDKNSTKDVAGTAIAKLAPIIAGDYTVRLGVKMFGDINVELADTQLNPTPITVERISDATGAELVLGTGAGATVAALFANATVVGYDLDARRTNLNRRQRGQLLDTTYYNQVYTVPLRSPITIPRPLTIGDQNDSSDLAALITATHIRTTNAAIEEIFKVQDMLAAYVNPADSLDEVPEIMGVSRFLVKPFFQKVSLDLSTQMDSLTSNERIADIRATLVNQLRDLAYRMYRDSNYKAAADALAGGQSSVPTVIVGTDPVIAQYLMVEGDLRTLGNDFQVKVVSTLNQNMKGKIVLSFGDFTSGKDGVPNPMHFGNMAWKPELTLVLPIHRNGGNSKELTVQPSFLHIVNLPILAVVEVEGIEDVVVSKVTLNMHDVA